MHAHLIGDVVASVDWALAEVECWEVICTRLYIYEWGNKWNRRYRLRCPTADDGSCSASARRDPQANNNPSRRIQRSTPQTM